MTSKLLYINMEVSRNLSRPWPICRASSASFNIQGLNYANLPKILLKFHRYGDHCRTPLEEHLVEAAAYTQDRHQVARLHVTVTPAHAEAVQAHIEASQAL